jgi:hypothetical protein
MSEFSAPGGGMRKEPSIDGIEIYEVSDGSEGSIEVGKKFIKYSGRQNFMTCKNFMP